MRLVVPWLCCWLFTLAGASVAVHAHDAWHGADEHLRFARHAEAEEAARTRIAVDDSDSLAWSALAEALAARGRDGAAAEAFQRAMAGPHPLRVRVAWAELLRRRGDREAAESEWRAVVAQWREGLDASLPHHVDELVAVARAAAALGRSDSSLRRTALRILEEAMARAPEQPSPRVAMADLLLDSYNNQEARPLYEEALTLDGDEPRALLGMARSLHFDHAGSAREAVLAALRRAPDLVQARLMLARLDLDDDRPEAARQALEAALEVNPRSVPALAMLAALAERDGDDDRASALINLMQTITPSPAEGFVLLAEIAADRRRYADAVRYAARAMVLEPDHWQAHALIGMNRLRLGDVPAARAALERAFRGDPFNVWSKNTLDLIDAMERYTELSEGRFLLVARDDHARVLAPYLLPIAEAAYEAHFETYDTRPRLPLRIEVHPEHDDLSVRTLGLTGVDLLGVSFGPTVVVDTPMANPGGPANWASVLWHELAHSFQLDLSLGRAPRWLAEGMAVFDEHRARPGWGQDVGPSFLQAWVEGRLASASELNSRFLNPQGPQDIGHAYLQAGLLVAMIHRDHGAQALRDLLAGFRRGGRSAALVEEVLGLQPAQLDAAFVAYMDERFGEALAALRPGEEADDASHYAKLLREGLTALDEGELDRAEPLLLEARRLVPGHGGRAGPHRGLVRLYRARGDRASQIAALDALVTVDADDLEAHLDLAALLQEAGRDGEAADILERAILISPFDAALHRRLALLMEADEDWARSRREWQAVVLLGAQDPVEARFGLARAAQRGGDAQAARGEVLRLLETAPLYEPGLELLMEVREVLAQGER